MADLYTIGVSKRSAQNFFDTLKKAGITKVIDIRLHNQSQLAGFSKQDDLEYFLGAIDDIGYEHRPEWAPDEEILDEYRKKRIGWEEFRDRILALIGKRKIEQGITAKDLDKACLLCSEPSPDHCHRRFVAEYLADRLPGVKIHHL